MISFESKSSSDSQAILDFFERIHRITSLDQLEAVVRTAALHQAREITIKDKGNLCISLGLTSVAGIPVFVSAVPEREKIFIIKFS